MLYKLKNKTEIYEIETEQTIKKFDNPNEAKNYYRFLNLGGAFDGWTPSFILKKMEITYE